MAESFGRESAAVQAAGYTIYSAPNFADTDRAIVLSVMLANVSTTASVDVTARLQVSGGGFMTGGHLAKEITIAADSTLELIPNKLVLKRNEKLHLLASVDNRLEATISVLEIT